MPKKEKRYKYELPELPETYSGCPEAVVCIPAAWIPLLSGHLAKLEQRHEWASKDDWLAGYQVVAEIEECLIMSCFGTGIQTMIDEQRRLYRLIDAIYNGTQYTAVEFGELGGGGGSWGGGGGGGGTWGDPEGGGGTWGSTEEGEIIMVPGEDEPTYYLVEPPLPAAPPDYTVTPPIAPALRARFERLEHLIDNLANGRVYLTDAQNPDEEPLDDVSLREQMRRIILSLDGGAETAPTSPQRNAVLLLDQIKRKLIEADPDNDSLLEEIRKLLV